MHQNEKQKLSIIIPVHNRKHITLTCLGNLDQLGYLKSEHIIVIDDGSTDGTSDEISSRFPDVVILPGDGSLWWTGAIRKGMKYAYEEGATCFIWLNDDCLVSAGTFECLEKFVRDNPDSIIGAQGYKDESKSEVLFGGKRRKIPHYSVLQYPMDKTLPCEMLSGNLVCFSRSVVDKISFPDTSLPHYGGDTLYLVKARKAGFKLFVDTHTIPIEIPTKSSDTYPSSWLLYEGPPLSIIRLLFKTQSMLSFKVWWVLLTTEYGIAGSIIFLLKHVVLIPKILMITCVRFLPLSTRIRIKNILHYLVNTVRLSILD